MLRSLRSRIALGAVLWTIGLIVIAHLMVRALMWNLPHLAHWGTMGTVAFISIVAGLSQVLIGLAPFARLRKRLSEVRDGRDRRVEGTFPTEVQPLVDDLNGLLDDRERRLSRALAKAGDLAHGLKTPLAVLMHDAERAEAAGQHELAQSIHDQVDRMRRQVEYHLAQARAAESHVTPGARCAVLESARGLATTMLRLHAGRGVALELEVSSEHVVRVRREDLDEMLGNLLDNAFKWGRARVAVRAAREGAKVVVTVDDDGPGLDPSMRDAVLQRGVRADQAAPGSGLGLAIVRDLAELHGGSVALSTAPAGGLRARLVLPAA